MRLSHPLVASVGFVGIWALLFRPTTVAADMPSPCCGLDSSSFCSDHGKPTAILEMVAIWKTQPTAVKEADPCHTWSQPRASRVVSIYTSATAVEDVAIAVGDIVGTEEVDPAIAARHLSSTSSTFPWPECRYLVYYYQVDSPQLMIGFAFVNPERRLLAWEHLDCLMGGPALEFDRVLPWLLKHSSECSDELAKTDYGCSPEDDAMCSVGSVREQGDGSEAVGLLLVLLALVCWARWRIG